MARQRDYRSEEQRRNELARARGFRTRAEERRFDRHIKNRRDFEALPTDAREQRDLALKTVSLLRNEPGISLEAAAARSGTNPDAVLWWAGDALSRENNRWKVRQADRIYRAMRVHSDGRTIEVDVRGSRKASLLAAHHDAVHHYLETGDTEPLDRFIGRSVAGRRLETDPDVLDEMARRHGLDIESIYQLVGS